MALEEMKPIFRQVPPTYAFFEDDFVDPELPCADRADIACRPCSDDHQLAVNVRNLISLPRKSSRGDLRP
jgi:hypothetical protein